MAGNGGEFRPPNLVELSQRLINQQTLSELTKNSQSLVKLMTTEEEEEEGNGSCFKEVVSRFNARGLQTIGSIVTDDSANFLTIARNPIGFSNLVVLLGKSVEVDSYFSNAIGHCFLALMTNKISSYLVIEALEVFNTEKKETIYKELVYHANYLACDEEGYIILNEIITNHLTDLNYRSKICHDKLATRALDLSVNSYGYRVLNHMIGVGDNAFRRIIALSLQGNVVRLSFNVYASLVLLKLLDTADTKEMLLVELSQCEGTVLVNMAKSNNGNMVLEKTLTLGGIYNRSTTSPFSRLIRKLMPLTPHLTTATPGGNIVDILRSF